MTFHPEITQRDLRTRSREIMDAVEHGESFTVTGRRPRRRVVDLMIASTAIAEGLPLYTTNPDDFAGLESVFAVMRVTRPPG